MGSASRGQHPLPVSASSSASGRKCVGGAREGEATPPAPLAPPPISATILERSKPEVGVGRNWEGKDMLMRGEELGWVWSGHTPNLFKKR